MANLKTSLVVENEIIKADDIENGYDSSIYNITTALKAILSVGNVNYVIGGKVSAAGGMNIDIAPILAYSSSTGDIALDTDIMRSIPVEPANSSLDRIDIVEIKCETEGYDIQKRAIFDQVTKSKMYVNMETKKKIIPSVVVKTGTPGNTSAPAVDPGFVKIAEILIPASSMAVTGASIRNITAVSPDEPNAEWTSDKNSVFTPGYLTDVFSTFLKTHNTDGSHKAKVIHANNMDYGTGFNQINASQIPTAQGKILHGTSYASSQSVTNLLSAAIDAINALYSFSGNTLSRYSIASTLPRAATTDNINLSAGGVKTVDGVVCNQGDVVLVKNQTDPGQNGLYTVSSSGSWSRTEEFSESHPDSLRGKLFLVAGGTVNGGCVFFIPDDLVTIGESPILFDRSFFSDRNSLSIMVRNREGNTEVATPTSDKHAANKKYVDDRESVIKNSNVASATKLNSARKLKTDLNATADATFDGTANQESIPVTGILPVGNGGTGKATARAANNAILESMAEESGDVSDNTYLTGAYSNSSDTGGAVYKRKFSTIKTWIKGLFGAGTGTTYSDGKFSVTYGNAANTACQGNDSRLSNARTPTAHASSSTTYGVGSTSEYGHVKTVNGLTTASHSSGLALSAYQGKVLKDEVDGKVPTSRKVNGKALSSDVILYGGDVAMSSSNTTTLKSAIDSKVSAVTYDATNKKITRTINGTAADVVTVATLKSAMSLAKGDVGLGNVDNKSLTELTSLLCPIGTILPFGGSSAPNGFLICDGRAISRTGIYASLFAVIGTLYGNGNGTTTFNIPDLRDRFPMGANTNALGTKIEAGLPNITATSDRIVKEKGTGSSGAFEPTAKEWDISVVSSSTGNHYNGGYWLRFDASKSNAIYGASNTVQPPAVAINYIIKY